MLLSGLAVRRTVAGIVGAGAMICGGTALAGAEPPPAPPAPPPPGCTAGDLAGVAAGVASSTSAYLFTHADVNDFLTGLHGRPDDEVRADLQTYFDANPQARGDLTGIRQPLVDLRNRCEWEGGPGGM